MSIEKQEMAIKKACQYLLKNCPTSMECVDLKEFYAVPENVNDIEKCFWNLMFYKKGKNHADPFQLSGLILKIIALIQNEAPKFSQFVICKSMKKQMKELQAFIIGKNKSYGGSVFNHTGFHSQLNALEKIKVRLDDKINRDFCGGKYDNEDTIKDLLGYYILYIAVEIYEKEIEKLNKDKNADNK